MSLKSLKSPILKKLALALVVLAHFQSALGQTKKPAFELAYKDAAVAQDVFAVKNPGEASFFITDLPYNEWKTKAVGQFVDMEVAPLYRGNVMGVKLPAPQAVTIGKEEDQMLDFLEAVNKRNEGGRQKFQMREAYVNMSADKALKAEEANTQVVQTVLSTVINRPSTTIKFTTAQFAKLPEKIDMVHAHYEIPGSLALQALEETHIAGKSIRPDQLYLMSAIDLRIYECQGLQTALEDEFRRRPEKERLWKSSIYMISDMQVNNPADIEAMAKYLGKRPDTVLSQNIIYADHLLRGGRTIFAFIPEGNQTRLVLIANMAIQQSYLVGNGLKAQTGRKFLMDGSGVAVDVGNALKQAIKHGDVKSVISKADMDIFKKNKCDKGLGMGLKAYSKKMLNLFVENLQN